MITPATALDHFELLAGLVWPTRTLLERTSALDADSFLNVGCGIGHVACRAADDGVKTSLGVNVNAEVIDADHRRSRSSASNAEFRVSRLGELGTMAELSEFDVYAGCLISPTADPRGAGGFSVGSGGRICPYDLRVMNPTLVRSR